MRGDLPGVAPSVFYHTTAVAIGHLGWLFEGARAGVESALIRRVGIADVYVEKGGHRAANSGVADHDLRIADPDHGRNVLLIFTRCAKHLLDFFFSSRSRHTSSTRDWSSDVCSSDLLEQPNSGRDVVGLRCYLFGLLQ